MKLKSIQEEYDLSDSKDSYYVEKKFNQDFNNDGIIGANIEKTLVPRIEDTTRMIEPELPEFKTENFASSYAGTDGNDDAGWGMDFATESQLIQTLGGDDFITNSGIIDYLAIEAGDGADSAFVFPPHEQEMTIILSGEEGDDRLEVNGWSGGSYSKNISIFGGDGDDVLGVSVEMMDNSEIMGGNGADSLSGANIVWGGDGDDEILSANIVFAGDGDDTVKSKGTKNPKPKIIFGGPGNDELYGAHEAYINGGEGNDRLGHAEAYGDPIGAIFELSTGSDVIHNFEPWGENVIVINSDIYGSDVQFEVEGNDIRINGNGINTLVLSQFDDLPLDINDLTQATFYIDGPGDTSGGINPELGGIGNGSGDSYSLPITTNVIEGTNGKNKLRGKKSNDSILGLGGKDKINGKKGDDILDGGKGNDTLKGSKGDDYIFGSQGLDILFGGKGSDVFKTSKGGDVVKDFNLNQGDRVGLDQGTEYEVIKDVDGTLIRVSDDIRILLLDQDYEEFLAAGNYAIARITSNNS